MSASSRLCNLMWSLLDSPNPRLAGGFPGRQPARGGGALFCGARHRRDGRARLSFAGRCDKLAALPALRHRILLKPEADRAGLTTDQVLTQVIAAVEVPK